MTYCHRLHVLAFGLLAGGLLFFTGCDFSGSNMDEEEEQGDASVELSANIQSDRTLSADTHYVVTSSFCVENSSTLTIEAGTRLAFESGTGLKVCGDCSVVPVIRMPSDEVPCATRADPSPHTLSPVPDSNASRVPASIVSVELFSTQKLLVTT